MSNLPGKKRPYQDHLRYKHMVARLQGLPVYKKEAALIVELARGRRWRIDAALEAACTGEGQEKFAINWDDVYKLIGRYGRLTALSRVAEIFALESFDPATPPDDRHPRHRGVHRCFDEAVIHGHYRVAEQCWKLGGRTNVYLDHREESELPRAMNAAIAEKDFSKIDYLLSRGGDATYSLSSAVAQGDLSIVAHLLDRGADPNAAASGSFSMLETALAYCQDEVFDLLVARGADVAQHADALYFRLITRSAGEAEGVKKLKDAGVPVSDETLRRAARAGKAHLFAAPKGGAPRQSKP
jgi:hypothetical protein